MKPYDGQVAVVTGASSGIGLATARLLLEQGARVAICARGEGRLLEVAAVMRRDHGEGRVLARAVNVLDPAAVGAFAAEVELKLFSQIPPTRAFLPMLREARGAIVAVNSLLAYQPEPHMVCTSSARAAVQNLLKSLSVELAPEVRVNSVLMGLIGSGQWTRRFAERPDKSVSREDWYADLARRKGIPLGRLGDPAEAAAAIAFLGSRAASYITGAQLEVSGGLSRHI